MTSKMYVYQHPNRAVSTNWHNGGGILIITDRSPREAWEMYCAENGLATENSPYDEGETVPPLAEEGEAIRDDRPRVCRMWREKGITTFQVGDPHVEF